MALMNGTGHYCEVATEQMNGTGQHCVVSTETQFNTSLFVK